MNIALRKPRMTRAQFFVWAEAQDKRYEFDGFQPVAMPSSTINHNHIVRNIYDALRGRLKGSSCRPMGPDDGVSTIGETVRYPDALITCTRTPGTSRLVEGPVVVFEVISPGNGANDRIIKVREYLAVPSIHTYVIVEQNSIGVTLHRRHDTDGWITTTLTAEDALRPHDPEIEIPLPEFYKNVDLPDHAGPPGS